MFKSPLHIMNHLKISQTILVALLSLFIASCGSEDETVYDETQEDYLPVAPDYNEFTAELADLEKKIIATCATKTPDENLLKEGTTKFQDFAGFFPQDPKAPDYLLKASDYALRLGQVEKSVKILDRIINEYPDYSKMEDVMFNKASHLDFELRDTTSAKIAYQEFITKYPNSDFVDDAQNRIKYISYSLEELSDKFMKDMESQPK